MRRSSLLLAALLFGCASQKPEAPASTAQAAAPVPAAPAQAAAPVQAPTPVPPTLRLSASVRPTHYAVQLTVVPTEETFQGVMEIELDSREPLPVLWLNADGGLTVQKAQATVKGQVIPGTPLPQKKDFVGVAFATPLPAGAATVRLEYTGVLSRKDQGGATKQQVDGAWYAFTHFEPIDARRAFPCFDEPGFKVPWQLTLHVPQGNARLHQHARWSPRTERPTASTGSRFARRPSRCPATWSPSRWARSSVVDAGTAGRNKAPDAHHRPQGARRPRPRYAAKVIRHRSWTGWRTYFGIPYPYEKLDVASPCRCFGGAMENPGLVTFIAAQHAGQARTRRRSPSASALRRRQHARARPPVVRRPVTMAWWDDLWLNEAFATLDDAEA